MAKILEKPVSVLKNILDVILPPVCYVCGISCSSKYGLCDGCLGKIRRIPQPSCPACGRHPAENGLLCGECASKKYYIERAWSCCYYENVIKECVHLFKYNGYLGLVDIFNDIMTAFIAENGIDKNIDLVIPVPLFGTKKRERTYNHSEVLARAVAKRLAVPVDTKNLRKIKWTQSQSELTKEKRMRNIKEAFVAVDNNAFFGKNVLIVDDVYTTGATVNECARVLLKAKANKVFSITLARGI
ncbi:MAG: ComF family protein [Candidatus Omnitrophica bacterium]|nr:ComF family protein [Candidatus Omnitrophota bacterium]